MSSIKVKFRQSTATAGRCRSVYYQVIVNRTVRQITPGIVVNPEDWNDRECNIRIQAENARSVRQRIARDVALLGRLIHSRERSGIQYDADDIVADYKTYISRYKLSAYFDSLIVSLKSRGRHRTAETYRSTKISVMSYLKEDIPIDMLDEADIVGYEAHLKRKGLSLNTCSFYMRVLRSVYNKACRQSGATRKNIFANVYTGVEKTVKRALPQSILTKMKNADLCEKAGLSFARDMFMLSFYLRGMSFVDMAFLRKSDLRNGILTYRRHKTGRRLSIKWTEAMQTIVDRYPKNRTEYLLPIIDQSERNELTRYRSQMSRINKNLKKIAALLNVSDNISMYCARHSWASLAKVKGIPLSVISEGMGHDSEMTTRIYLASLENSVIDDANDIVISSI